MSHPTQDLKWSNKILLQFEGARNSLIVCGQQNLIPNLKLYITMILVMVSLLGLLYMLHSSLGSSNQLLYSKHKLSVSLTLNLCENHNVNGVYRLLSKNKLRWI